MRNFHQCFFCGKRFVVEWSFSSLSSDTQTADAHHCAGMDAAISDYQQGRPGQETGRAAAAVRYFAPGVALKFKPKAAPDKCGHKCRNAKRADCSCECGGEHHGADATTIIGAFL